MHNQYNSAVERYEYMAIYHSEIGVIVSKNSIDTIAFALSVSREHFLQIYYFMQR